MVHAHCGRNRAIPVSVPPESRVIESPALPSILPYCRSSGVRARRCGVYYSRCSLYITLHASHILDRVPHPLVRNGRRSRPVVPHHFIAQLSQHTCKVSSFFGARRAGTAQGLRHS